MGNTYKDSMKGRSADAMSACFRKAGAMKHKNVPRQGARNQRQELLSEYEEYLDIEQELDMLED